MRKYLCARTLPMRLAQSGSKIDLLTATAGDLGSMTQNRWQVAARRTSRAAKAAALIGAEYQVPE